MSVSSWCQGRSVIGRRLKIDSMDEPNPSLAGYPCRRNRGARCLVKASTSRISSRLGASPFAIQPLALTTLASQPENRMAVVISEILRDRYAIDRLDEAEGSGAAMNCTSDIHAESMHPDFCASALMALSHRAVQTLFACTETTPAGRLV